MHLTCATSVVDAAHLYWDYPVLSSLTRGLSTFISRRAVQLLSGWGLRRWVHTSMGHKSPRRPPAALSLQVLPTPVAPCTWVHGCRCPSSTSAATREPWAPPAPWAASCPSAHPLWLGRKQKLEGGGAKSLQLLQLQPERWGELPGVAHEPLVDQLDRPDLPGCLCQPNKRLVEGWQEMPLARPISKEPPALTG